MRSLAALALAITLCTSFAGTPAPRTANAPAPVTQATAPPTRPPPPGASPAPAAAPRWRWPLRPAPEVVRPFAPPASPWGPGHRGVDLAARPGQTVYAPAPGRISYAGRIAGRDVIAITHGALRTTYTAARPLLRPGRPVAPGTRIGVVEELPGHCPRRCLHWGLLRDLTYLDPLSLLRTHPRLLPLWPAPSGADPLRP